VVARLMARAVLAAAESSSLGTQSRRGSIVHWNLDTPGALLAVLSIFGLLLSGLIFVIDARISRIRKEMTPNGGTSMRDVLDRIEKQNEKLEEQLDHHITWHLEQPK